MSHKSYLGPEQKEQLLEIINPPLTTPDGDVRTSTCFFSESVSSWLGARLEERMESIPGWKEAQPILLGSWARNELCPKSDIDLLFCGDEQSVLSFVTKAQEEGLKIRYRMPQDPSDWTVGVQAFDVLALLKAKPLTTEAAKKLFQQQRLIWSRKEKFRKGLLKAIQKERAQRAERYDSITNYLEPHIKFGPGGLRDLEQAAQVYELFAEKFTNAAHALNVLNYYRQYFLTIRQKLHSDGGGDVLISTSQFDIAKWLGFKTHKEFMKSLQRGLSRVHFYSDWIVATASASEKDVVRTNLQSYKHPTDLSSALHKNSGVLVQKQVRDNLDLLFSDTKQKKNARVRGKILGKVLDIKAEDDFLMSVFRSRLIDKLVPEFSRLVGYVQHDQYHRFTADSHIMQACREAKRLYRKPALLGGLKFLHKAMTAYDWKVLSWTCLYHDLAKGLEGDHSEVGVRLAERDLKEFGFPKKFIDDIKWMVRNHLELSQAAFRKNPRDPKVWQELRKMGVENERVRRLAVFTVIDIRATNPEAWNDWKARLLKDLVQNLESGKAQGLHELNKLKIKKKIRVSDKVLEELGLSLVESLSVEEIIEDLRRVFFAKGSATPRVIKTNKGEVWIRFHQRTDRPGLLVDYVTHLYSLGLSIRHASIHTLSGVGVYDWFHVGTQKSLEQIKRMLLSPLQPKKLSIPKVDQVQWVSVDSGEWVVSFKGPDQSGFLAGTAQVLRDLGLDIRSAQVHTWGRQVDDVFFLRAPAQKNPEEVLEGIRQKLKNG